MSLLSGDLYYWNSSVGSSPMDAVASISNRPERK